ncbi:XRE family transcriptional regulator [Pikeienuella piscinae]|uniref:XRE family transcriptional regulator n=2 Tax=Pikeienuella piscinae TaxID=2748098 RepID=A0A7M3T7E8_9RHOB|nr:XRE family transcriptional regulator [Pikeienuella piscinae]
MRKRSAVGERLRRVRRANGWTLKNMSERTGVSIATLSKVERDKLSLTYDKLLQLAEGLDMSLSELIAPEDDHPPTARRSIMRGERDVIVETKNYEYNYIFSDLRNKQMIPIITRVKARSISEFGPLLSHSGEEFIFVLEGKIEVHTQHYGPVELLQGHGIYIDSTMGHAYVNTGDDEATVLGVCSAESLSFASAVASDSSS